MHKVCPVRTSPGRAISVMRKDGDEGKMYHDVRGGVPAHGDRRKAG